MQNMRKGTQARVKGNKLFNWLGGEQDGYDHGEGTKQIQSLCIPCLVLYYLQP